MTTKPTNDAVPAGPSRSAEACRIQEPRGQEVRERRCLLSAAIAGGAFVAQPLASLAGLDSVESIVGSTGTAQAAPCTTGLFCDAVNGGDAAFGQSIGALGNGATQFGALFDAFDPMNLVGPGVVC